MQQQRSDTTSKFTRYLNVANAALDRHYEDFPYKQLIRAGNNLLEGRNLGVAVYKHDASQPHDYFTVQWRDGSLQLLEHGKRDPDLSWKVRESYLDEVIDNPEPYIEHPAKLDWQWLKSRVDLA